MRVLITGGTGSLGAALVRHFLHEGAEKIVVFSRDEVKQGDLAKSLGFKIDNPRVRFFLGDVRDHWRLVDAMWGIDTVIHTAALKRVDQVSYNPTEVLKTNVLGTQNVLQAATEARVQRVLLISSDKAVHPTNVYGASKQMAEFLTVRHNVYSHPKGTACAVLRYGNVWGSRGSIVEVFREQIVTGTLTVTDPEMTRFFVTLPQAVGYVQRALDFMEGGEIFVPARLPAWTLKQVVALFAPQDVQVTGRRTGGEKAHEQLISDEEERRVTEMYGMYVVVPEPHEWTTTYGWDGAPRVPVHYYASNNTEAVPPEVLVEAVYEPQP